MAKAHEMRHDRMSLCIGQGVGKGGPYMDAPDSESRVKRRRWGTLRGRNLIFLFRLLRHGTGEGCLNRRDERQLWRLTPSKPNNDKHIEIAQAEPPDED